MILWRTQHLRIVIKNCHHNLTGGGSGSSYINMPLGKISLLYEYADSMRSARMSVICLIFEDHLNFRPTNWFSERWCAINVLPSRSIQYRPQRVWQRYNETSCLNHIWPVGRQSHQLRSADNDGQTKTAGNITNGNSLEKAPSEHLKKSPHKT